MDRLRERHAGLRAPRVRSPTSSTQLSPAVVVPTNRDNQWLHAQRVAANATNCGDDVTPLLAAHTSCCAPGPCAAAATMTRYGRGLLTDPDDHLGDPLSEKEGVVDVLPPQSGDQGCVGAVALARTDSSDARTPLVRIVDLAVFERVQEIRSLRARTLNPGRPTDGYVLSKLARCERCGAAMHGTKGGRNDIRRHYCAGRKQGHRLRWLATAGTRRTSRRALREYAPTLGVLGF